MYKVDARGEACPKPVLMTKAAVQNGEEEIQTLVDNPTAVQNLSRFAASVGYTHESQEDNGVYTVTLKKDPNADVQKAEAYEDRSWSIFCTENRIGSADNELGRNLINMYFYTLTQMDTPPSVIAFMNEGVMLPCENEQIVESLKTLMEKGTRVLVCGTCLNFFGITDKLQCGTVSNMYEILEAVTACGKMMRV
ncbi:sulfurtransferase-like selenium metabolism protein YedF [Intestinimonas sp. MSJ-38]|uniref:sulfurtransferase-like selenium metabolism protein YedF n=1 Tax=Intestinimonas sp. MSJ-38 TaxID=2841532 RepID=UPI001C0FB128|nr:sulfurtransferase-like selenium metabolism protein YedF [Intestinimonas sp. MSJ-38]MBU5432422.1 sulfurtransferase-like selenium metabolism protein YedF [Intestinimonas sp. MSJ-38]